MKMEFRVYNTVRYWAGRVVPTAVSGQNVLQLSHPLLDLCNQLVALQTLVVLHTTAVLLHVFLNYCMSFSADAGDNR